MSKQTMMTWLFSIGLAFGASAQQQKTQPFQASLTPDIAVCDRSDRIEGVALSIWGENPQSAFALGFVNGSNGDSSGLSLGFFGNYAENYTGVQWGFVNYASESLKGVQLGCVNLTKELNGLQWGLVNYAETAKAGVQVGLVNILPANQEWFSKLPNELAPGMIFVNWHF